MTVVYHYILRQTTVVYSCLCLCCTECPPSVFQLQVQRLYRGLSVPLATVALTNAVTFGVYGAMCRKFGDNNTGQIATNGAVAGFIRVGRDLVYGLFHWRIFLIP